MESGRKSRRRRCNHYVVEHPRRRAHGSSFGLSEKLHAEVIPADATSVEDLENVFKRSVEVLGGKIDFVLHSIGMSPNVRKKRPYDDLDYSLLDKTLDISAISFHKMLQVAKKLDAINEYGSVIALSYVAAQRTLFGYNDMADAKALLESIARSFGYIYGREKERAYQHHFAIAYHDDRRQRSQRHELSHGLCQPYVSAG